MKKFFSLHEVINDSYHIFHTGIPEKPTESWLSVITGVEVHHVFRIYLYCEVTL